MINIRQSVSLAPLTWFKVGGVAQHFARPSNVDELLHIIKQFPNFTIIGNTSNLLIADGLIEGCIIKLGSGFGKITQIAETEFDCGAACLDSTLAQFMQSQGVSGMEFLATIPGSLGGNIIMNAGCFGGEIFDVLKSVTILTLNGKVETIQKKDISHSYRHAVLPQNSIVLSAVLCGVKSMPENVQNTMDGFLKQRLENQPSNVRTGGSTFKNPKGHSAWKLIQEADAHKLKVGGAEVSPKHSNFLINTGGATAQDIFTLGELIRKQVFEKTGIMLEWEIKRIGHFKELPKTPK